MLTDFTTPQGNRVSVNALQVRSVRVQDSIPWLNPEKPEALIHIADAPPVTVLGEVEDVSSRIDDHAIGMVPWLMGAVEKATREIDAAGGSLLPKG